MRRATPTLALLLLLAAGAARADGEEAPAPRPHTDEQMEEHQVLETFAARYASDDVDDRILAVRTLGRWRHADVLKRLEKIYLREDRLEIKAAAAAGLGQQTPFAKKAGRTLVRGLAQWDDWASREAPEGDDELLQRLEAEVLVQALRAVGALGYKDGWKDIEGYIEHPNDDVAAEMMLTCGRLKEYRALEPIHAWFEFYPDGHSWAGGSVTVDTGAAGGADAAAARARWRAKYGGRAARARPQVWEQMAQAVEMITGERIETPDALAAWMKANEALMKRHGA